MWLCHAWPMRHGALLCSYAIAMIFSTIWSVIDRNISNYRWPCLTLHIKKPQIKSIYFRLSMLFYQYASINAAHRRHPSRHLSLDRRQYHSPRRMAALKRGFSLLIGISCRCRLINDAMQNIYRSGVRRQGRCGISSPS